MRTFAFLALTAPLLSSLQAQTVRRSPREQPAAEQREKLTELPVTHVSLYKNGVGFFEHTGSVNGEAAVTIDFTTAQLNDVLQSLTAIDLGGGRISGAGYNSTTPLDQQLRSLPLELGEEPTAVDLYNALRGARVQVHSAGSTFSGRLLSLEVRSTPSAPPGTDENRAPVERRTLTVVDDAGSVRSIELTSATTVRLLDSSVQADLSRYLRLIASSHNQGLRHLTLLDRGVGQRELHVSYISEVPVWKSTYRLLITGKPPLGASPTVRQTATLQGWAVVDNTVGTDWNNVQLSLIAGAPQSFIQPLSDPIYSRRPEVPIAEEAQLTPQTHDSGITTMKEEAAPPSVLSAPTKLPRNRSAGIAGMSGFAGSGTGSGTGAGASGGVFGGMGTGAAAAPRIETAIPRSYEEAATASVIPQSSGVAFDDFFEYKLTEPITIRKNESALVPILQGKVTAERVTLVSTSGSLNGYATNGRPLRALWLTNSTGLTLDRGSFSVVEDGAFGGEGLLDPIHPNELRLLSYAADSAVQVTTEEPTQTNRILRLTGSKGVLKIKHGEHKEITYVVHNTASEPRTVVLEHPVERGLELTSTPKPDETTASLYRWRIDVAAGETTRLHIAGEHVRETSYILTRSNDNDLNAIVSITNRDPALERALQPVLDARRRVAEAQAALDQTKEHLGGLRGEEERQRANIAALAMADRRSRDRFVRDLNGTEDMLRTVQAELAMRTDALATANAELARRIEELQIDETM